MDPARTVSRHPHTQSSSQYPAHTYPPPPLTAAAPPQSQQYGQQQPYPYSQPVYQQAPVGPAAGQPIYAPVEALNPHQQQQQQQQQQQPQQQPPQEQHHNHTQQHQTQTTAGSTYSPAHSAPTHHPPAPHSAPPYFPQGASLPPIHGRDAPTYPSHASYNPLPPPPPPQASQSQQPGATESGTLPPFRPPSSTQHSPHDASREHNDPAHSSAHSRSGHGTPASAMQRPQDTLARQRTPSTPAHAASYAVGVAPEQSVTPSQHMEHPHSQPYPPHQPLPNGMHHGHHPHAPPPPPQPPSQHPDPQAAYAPQPILDPQTGQYAVHPSQAPVYQHAYGPAPAYPTAVVTASSNTAAANGKRKPMRAQQACDQCRQRKQKCDEGQPCSFCREQSLNCNYRDPGPAKTDKNTEKVLSTLELIMDHIKTTNVRLARLEGSSTDLKPLKGGSPSTEADADMSETPEAKVSRKPVQQSEHVRTPRPPAKSESWPNHRTGPHNLIMLWPSIQPFFHEINHKFDSSYVMRAEERGILRINGKGEGVDDQEGNSHAGPASPARSDDSSDNASTPREGLWGRGYIGNTSAEAPRNVPTEGGLNSDGSLDLNTSTINSLFDTFMKHMYIMHPFLDRKRTRRMVDTFMNHYSPSRAKVYFLNGSATKPHSSSDAERSAKRLRTSNGPNSTTSTSGSDSTTRSTLQIEHSPANAIVLLMLALGKICQHTAPLPAVHTQTSSQHVTSNSHLMSSSPMSAPLMPASISPRSTPWTQPTPPENGGIRIESRSRRSSFDTVGITSARNMEIIPGLAYYNKAAEIIGGHVDGTDLLHAQMFLLAALYKGQLARVKESMSWLFLAGKICHSLIDRHNLYWPPGRVLNEEQTQLFKDKRVRMILMAAWTCLQLEADILAEMSYPPSPIQQIEAAMLPPQPTPDDDDYHTMEHSASMGAESANDIRVHFYYTAQLYLRRRLNNTHKQLYGDELRHQSVEFVRATMEDQQREIQEWRNQIPEALRWSDDDPPASNILDARLRAKWYGAFYVIHRPFLDYTLHIMPRVQEGSCSVEEAARDAEDKPRDPADIVLFKAIRSMAVGDIWTAAGKCVDAALQSTVALDGMPGRLVVTNIHGTAHAQFGNMLVLSATYNVPYLKHLVKKEEFQPKLDRTIKFLRKLSPISPTCAMDCSILERIQQKLFTPTEVKQIFHNEREPASATTSFST